MTGTSVLGIKFDGGVLLAADTLASYGSLARFDDISRLHQAGSHTCVAAGGDLSDFQELQHLIDGKLSGSPLPQTHSLLMFKPLDAKKRSTETATHCPLLNFTPGLLVSCIRNETR